jgi:hypothetical protein
MDIYGATVRGPAHIASGVPNQDAWAHAVIGEVHIAVVSDGVGSCTNASNGSRMACKAAIEAMRHWYRYPHASLESLLGLIHINWQLKIAPVSPTDSACTCLIAAISPDGSGILAQLGDGLIIFKNDDGVHTPWLRDEMSFSNQTEALGISKRLASWNTLRLPPGTKQVVLCTDGISDDLLSDQLDKFVDWICNEYKTLSKQKRWRQLASMLKAWPTPRHQDDKTIAIMDIGRSHK